MNDTQEMSPLAEYMHNLWLSGMDVHTVLEHGHTVAHSRAIRQYLKTQAVDVPKSSALIAPSAEVEAQVYVETSRLLRDAATEAGLSLAQQHSASER